jgi:hypothetical protein
MDAHPEISHLKGKINSFNVSERQDAYNQELAAEQRKQVEARADYYNNFIEALESLLSKYHPISVKFRERFAGTIQQFYNNVAPENAAKHRSPEEAEQIAEFIKSTLSSMERVIDEQTKTEIGKKLFSHVESAQWEDIHACLKVKELLQTIGRVDRAINECQQQPDQFSSNIAELLNDMPDFYDTYLRQDRALQGGLVYLKYAQDRIPPDLLHKTTSQKDAHTEATSSLMQWIPTFSKVQPSLFADQYGELCKALENKLQIMQELIDKFNKQLELLQKIEPIKDTLSQKIASLSPEQRAERGIIERVIDYIKHKNQEEQKALLQSLYNPAQSSGFLYKRLAFYSSPHISMDSLQIDQLLKKDGDQLQTKCDEILHIQQIHPMQKELLVMLREEFEYSVHKLAESSSPEAKQEALWIASKNLQRIIDQFCDREACFPLEEMHKYTPSVGRTRLRDVLRLCQWGPRDCGIMSPLLIASDQDKSLLQTGAEKVRKVCEQVYNDFFIDPQELRTMGMLPVICASILNKLGNRKYTVHLWMTEKDLRSVLNQQIPIIATVNIPNRILHGVVVDGLTIGADGKERLKIRDINYLLEQDPTLEAFMKFWKHGDFGAAVVPVLPYQQDYPKQREVLLSLLSHVESSLAILTYHKVTSRDKFSEKAHGELQAQIREIGQIVPSSPELVKWLEDVQDIFNKAVPQLANEESPEAREAILRNIFIPFPPL